MKKIMILLSLISLLTVGCSSDISQEKIGIRGRITSINIDGDNTTLLVEGKLEDDTTYDEAYVLVNKDTKVYKYEPSDESDGLDLELGFVVEVMFKGPVQETHPVQVTAQSIKVISE